MTHTGWTDPAQADADRLPPPLLTEKETRNRLQVSRATLDKMIRNKEITAIKVRRMWRFRREDVERFLEDRENTRE